MTVIFYLNRGTGLESPLYNRFRVKDDVLAQCVVDLEELRSLREPSKIVRQV